MNQALAVHILQQGLTACSHCWGFGRIVAACSVKIPLPEKNLKKSLPAVSRSLCGFSLCAVKPERTYEVCYLIIVEFSGMLKPGVSKLREHCEPNMAWRSNTKTCLWPKSDLWMASQCHHIEIVARSYQLAHPWDVYMLFLGLSGKKSELR